MSVLREPSCRFARAVAAWVLLGSLFLQNTAHAETPAPATDAGAPKPLEEANLALAATLVRYLPPKDAFDVPPDTSEMDGRPFRLAIGVVEAAKSYASKDKVAAVWKYDAMARRLVASTVTNEWSTYTFLRDLSSDYIGLRGFYFRSSVSKEGSYVGSNAFGASTRVTVYRGDTVAVGTFQRSGDPARSSDIGLTATIQIEPERARALTRNLVLVVEGTVTPPLNGRSVMCGVSYEEPTIDAPEEVHLNECMVATAIRRLSFQDRTTGETFAEWQQRP